MTTFPNAPRLVKGGIALLDPATLKRVRTIALQYNPDTVTRTLQPQTFGGEGADRTEAMRFKRPPVETIKVEAEIDAIDHRHLSQASVTTVLTRLLNNGGGFLILSNAWPYRGCPQACIQLANNNPTQLSSKSRNRSTENGHE